jgi:hypothetical protein
LECRTDRPSDLGFQLEKFTGIRPGNSGHWTGLAEICRPRLTGALQELALFNISAAKIIPIKIAAFKPGWCFHNYANLGDSTI